MVAAEVADAVMAAVMEFGGLAPLSDDATVVVVKRLVRDDVTMQESLVPLDLAPERKGP